MPSLNLAARRAAGTLAALLALAATARAESFDDWKARDRDAWRRFQQTGSTAPAVTPPADAAEVAPPAIDPPNRPVRNVSLPSAAPGPRLRSHPPRGERIFFVKKQDVGGITYSDFYTMDPSGGDVRQYTEFSRYLTTVDFPELTADGTHLAFVSDDRSFASACYRDAFLLDMAADTMVRITGDEQTTPPKQWGRLSVKFKNAGQTPLTLIAVSFKGADNYYSGSAAGDLRVPAGEPIWVKAIVKGGGPGVGDVRTVTVPEGGREAVELDLSQGTIAAQCATVSADRRQVAVSMLSQSGEAMLWSLGIWDDRGGIVHGAHWGGQGKPNGEWGPSFSPAGKWLAYCPGASFNNSLGTVATNRLDDKPRILVGTPPPGTDFCLATTWAPDGKTLVYSYGGVPPDFPLNLYRIPVAGGAPEPLTSYAPKAWVGRATFSPDGKRVAFTVFRLRGKYVVNDIYVMPVSGGEPQALTSDGVSMNPTWGIVP